MSQKALWIAAFFEQDGQIVMRICVSRVDLQTALITSLCVSRRPKSSSAIARLKCSTRQR